MDISNIETQNRWMRSPKNETNQNEVGNKRVRQRIPSVVDNINIQGLRPILEPGSHVIRRLVWAALVLVGIATCIAHISFQYMYFTSRPVRININVTYLEQLRFPVVTFCNFNPLRLSMLRGMGMEGLSGLFNLGDGQPLTLTNGPNLQEYKMKTENFNWSDVYTRHSHQLPDMLLEVRHGLGGPGGGRTKLKPCNARWVICDP